MPPEADAPAAKPCARSSSRQQQTSPDRSARSLRNASSAGYRRFRRIFPSSVPLPRQVLKHHYCPRDRTFWRCPVPASGTDVGSHQQRGRGLGPHLNPDPSRNEIWVIPATPVDPGCRDDIGDAETNPCFS